MRIVMFTPAIKTSAIARMACLVTHELSRMGHEVHVIRTENKSFFKHPTYDYGCSLISWNDLDLVGITAESADIVVYHIGNNFEYHQGCLEWLSRAPGIICLHDFFLGQLFWAWADKDRENAIKILKYWHGEQVAENYFNYQNSELFINRTKDSAPMTEWICEKALGVMTHSSWGIDRVLNACLGPVYVCPLAYDAPIFESAHIALNEKTLSILTIGHVNKNKRVASVLSAITDSKILRGKVVYRLVGKIDPTVAEELLSFAQENGVELIISGEVDDKSLAEAIGAADIISCLRWPSLEAASATAITAMLCGKPVIVTDTSFYSEIPDEYVMKVDPSDEINSLRTTLELLYQDKPLRDKIGKLSKEWAKKTFTAENYANQLIKISLSVNKTKPILNAVHYFTDMLKRWGATDQLINLDETIAPLKIFEKDNV